MFNRDRLRRRGPLMVATLFLIIGMSRPHQRALWFSVAAIFVLIGVRLRRMPQPPSAAPPE